MFKIILILNALWFAAAFHLFTLRAEIFAKTMIPRADRDTPVFGMFAEIVKFLGGFNFAFCLLNVLVLIYPDLFPEANQRIILCLAFAAAHGSQFLGNVPIALQNRKGNGAWQVKGRMVFIFVVDFVLMIGNLVVVGMYAF